MISKNAICEATVKNFRWINVLSQMGNSSGIIGAIRIFFRVCMRSTRLEASVGQG